MKFFDANSPMRVVHLLFSIAHGGRLQVDTSVVDLGLFQQQQQQHNNNKKRSLSLPDTATNHHQVQNTVRIVISASTNKFILRHDTIELSSMMLACNLPFLATLCLLIVCASSFAPTSNLALKSSSRPEYSSLLQVLKASESDDNDPKQVIGKKIIVKGDVNGGYVRTCIRNEVRP